MIVQASQKKGEEKVRAIDIHVSVYVCVCVLPEEFSLNKVVRWLLLSALRRTTCDFDRLPEYGSRITAHSPAYQEGFFGTGGTTPRYSLLSPLSLTSCLCLCLCLSCGFRFCNLCRRFFLAFPPETHTSAHTSNRDDGGGGLCGGIQQWWNRPADLHAV